jgi:K+-transporting ATPase ATPase A chain
VTYTVSMLFFHVGGFLILYALMRLQASLPFNPADQSAVAEDLSLNTAVSFITNTNWQNYGGESTLSYLVGMLGLTHQNFLSAATVRRRLRGAAALRDQSALAQRNPNDAVDRTRRQDYHH